MEDAAEITDGIKSMKLYSNVDRIWNELVKLGVDKNAAEDIPVDLLNTFDCYNYGGSDGAKRLVSLFSLHDQSAILDIGAGIGGPARCISAHCGARVLGVELQADLALLANQLCQRCGLSDRVHVITGDFTDLSLLIGDYGSFDAVMSWLVILHVPLSKRVDVYRRAHEMLRTGGSMYVEDYFLLNETNGFTAEESSLLQRDVFVPDGTLPTRQQYIDSLLEAGFQESSIDFQDVTPDWVQFTASRLDSWRRDKARHILVHNLQTWSALDSFYSTVAKLFCGGNLGGVKLTIKK